MDKDKNTVYYTYLIAIAVLVMIAVCISFGESSGKSWERTRHCKQINAVFAADTLCIRGDSVVWRFR